MDSVSTLQTNKAKQSNPTFYECFVYSGLFQKIHQLLFSFVATNRKTTYLYTEQRKRHIEMDSETKTTPPMLAMKRRKREQTQFQRPPPEFWDNLSHLWLTPRGLREFDRRTHQPNPLRRSNRRDNQIVNAASLKQFARRGGPDLSHIRGVFYAKSQYMTSFTDRISTQNLERACYFLRQPNQVYLTREKGTKWEYRLPHQQTRLKK